MDGPGGSSSTRNISHPPTSATCHGSTVPPGAHRCTSTRRLHPLRARTRGPSPPPANGSCPCVPELTLAQFVQCLANPVYLNYLAQQKTLDRPEFVAYLGYLQYFKQPKYAKFLQYVHRGARCACLLMLCVQSPWADTPRARIAPAGAFPSRDPRPGPGRQTGHRRPTECSTNAERLSARYPLCMLDARGNSPSS